MIWITRGLRRGCLLLLLLCIFFGGSVFSQDCNVTIHINSTNTEGLILSPSFPSSYVKLPEAYSCWVTLIPEDPGRHIQITFDDFHLSSDHTSCDFQEVDKLTIYSATKTYSNCGCHRPHVLALSGGEVRFELIVQAANFNDAPFRLYQARYEYLTVTEYMDLRDVYFYSDSTKPSISNDYGVLEWPAEPLPTFFNMEVIDVLYYIEATPGLKISLTAVFKNTAMSSNVLVIRDGITSQSPLLHLYESMQDIQISVVSSQESMYIRWTGQTQDTGIVLKIEYTAFKDPVSPNDCGSTDYFYCGNHRCIKTTLTCDSIDNCGDGSDEIENRPDDLCHSANYCDLSPCMNDGTCSPLKPWCHCPAGFWGEFCEFGNTDCNSAPCKNGASCQPYTSGSGVNCLCLPGFYGQYCDAQIPNGCLNDECLNDGACVDGNCICRENYYGNNCEYYDNTTTNTDYTDLQHTSIMIGAFVGAVCLLSICWLIAMARKRQYDEPSGRIHRIVSVHSRDERGMRPSVTAGSPIDLPPTYSDCVDDTDTPKSGNRTTVLPITEENLDDMDGDVFIADVDGPPLSPPPTYESVALSEDEEDGIIFEATGTALPDVVSQDRTPHRQTSQLDTTV